MTTHAATHFDTALRRDLPTSKAHTIRGALLLCGVISSLYYAGMTAYVTAEAEGYSSLSQAVSELSAIDAPTRQLWVVLGVPYTLLLIAFGWGVWLSAGPSRALRAVGALYVAEALIGAFWPPMHLRGAEPTLTDTLHIAWTAGWLVVMLTTMGLAAAVLGRRFRIYTFATLATFVVFGVLTSLDAPRLAAGLPTPYLGLWERINMGAGMVWIAVLALTLLRRDGSSRRELRRPGERMPGEMKVNRPSPEARHALAWLALPVFAVLNGLVRDTTYGPSMGYDLSHSVSVVPLLVAIVAWAVWVSRRWPVADRGSALRVGVVWLALTLAFEFGLGSLQGLSMAEMLAEYDVTRGRLWPLIPLSTLLAPPLVFSASKRRSTSL